ncbi:unnamed protein product [Rotaria sordida]|uniref:Uncharacterized protein n=1 Tax=Rotaria sordida TaxID=392033 RepID=A0A815JWX3_9BILA|nr:unnamed protein product [Rotaria sordida]CAF1331379.1 unnamed protein product [Rotaria sordida]CAF1383450.1 unnamed protein product [Rotaria sordida]CAF1384597.1 unnamed protein product [Rotaria sordida]CAF1617028.1 unnamed protein product [Rotaria sordida]
MRHSCIGFPSCLKTFENAYVLRGHQLSCEHAQKEINNGNNCQEHARSIQYDYDINGIKGNKFYPTFTGLDHTPRLYFRDRFQLGRANIQPYRPLRKPSDPSKLTSQTKSAVMDFSGYFT